MQARISNPAAVLPGAQPAVQELVKAAQSAGVDQRVLELVHLRVSQINGCSFCVDLGARNLKKDGETDRRLFAVAAWREAPWFTDAERAALALAEAATRIADRGNPVTDEVWNEAAKHYDEKQLGGITLMIGITNLFNTVNAAVHQPAGAWD